MRCDWRMISIKLAYYFYCIITGCDRWKCSHTYDYWSMITQLINPLTVHAALGPLRQLRPMRCHMGKVNGSLSIMLQRRAAPHPSHKQEWGRVTDDLTRWCDISAVTMKFDGRIFCHNSTCQVWVTAHKSGRYLQYHGWVIAAFSPHGW